MAYQSASRTGPHQVEPDFVPVVPIEAAQPIEHRRPTSFGAVKPDWNLRVLFFFQRVSQSSMYQK